MSEETTENPVETTPVEQQAPVADNRGRWYVLHTLSGHENKVCRLMQAAVNENDKAGVYEVHIPTHQVVEVRQRQKKTKTKKVFPGYIMVRMDLYNEDGMINQDAWFLVRNVQGVLGFVGNSDHPYPLTNAEAAALIGHEEGGAAAAVTMETYNVGEAVRITDGPFEGFEGSITDVDRERGLLKILVSIFGRATSLELESWQVERVK